MFNRAAFLVVVLHFAVPVSLAHAQRAVFETSEGEIVVALDRGSAPRSVETFLWYAEEGDYDESVFHRVVQGQVVQGGEYRWRNAEDELVRISPKENVPPFESDYKKSVANKRGTLAVMRPSGESEARHAPTGFFFNVADNEHFDYRRYDQDTQVMTPRGPRMMPAGAEIRGYSVIGRVVSGIEILDAIQQSETTERYPNKNWPVRPVIVRRVRIAP